MDSRLLNMLHDAGDVDILAVGNGIDIDLDRVGEEAVDEDRRIAEQAHRGGNIVGQRAAVATEGCGSRLGHETREGLEGHARQHLDECFDAPDLVPGVDDDAADTSFEGHLKFPR